MSRQSRTFKLKLSPAGMDLLIDAHCHVIRATRRLLAWGTTLQTGVDWLAEAPVPFVAQLLAGLPEAGFSGDEEHHLGAPKGLNVVAARIANEVSRASSGAPPPLLADIYIVALVHLLRTDGPQLRAVYNRTRRG